VLQTFAPHIFFDDSIKNYDAAKNVVPSGLVPYNSSSKLYVIPANAEPSTIEVETTTLTPASTSHP
jgi:5'-nucleotidase